MIDKTQLDNNFSNILCDKQKVLEDKYSNVYLKEINIEQLMYIGNYLNDLKPKSKIREYKQYLLNYLNQFIYNNKELDDIEINNAKKEYLEPVLSYLNKFHDFYTNNSLIYVRTAFGFVLDLLLILFGLAKYYYYLPIFMIIFFLFSMRKHNKLIKEGKILNL